MKYNWEVIKKYLSETVLHGTVNYHLGPRLIYKWIEHSNVSHEVRSK